MPYTAILSYYVCIKHRLQPASVLNIILWAQTHAVWSLCRYFPHSYHCLFSDCEKPLAPTFFACLSLTKIYHNVYPIITSSLYVNWLWTSADDYGVFYPALIWIHLSSLSLHFLLYNIKTYISFVDDLMLHKFNVTPL